MLTDREAWFAYLKMFDQISELENKTALSYFNSYPPEVLELITALSQTAFKLHQYTTITLMGKNPLEPTIFFGSPNSKSLNNCRLRIDQRVDKNGCTVLKGQS